MCTALAPISISRLASSGDFLDRSACDQVWLPIVCPSWATCLRISGCQMACLPIGKNVALMQCSASAASTAGVLCGQGPSSKVRTTSLSWRKSCSLKCSNPKPGPSVVSISTIRETPSTAELLRHVDKSAKGVSGTLAGNRAGTMDPVDSEYAGRDTRGAVAWAGVVFDDGTDNAALATGTVEAELWPRCISIAVRLTTTSAARPRNGNHSRTHWSSFPSMRTAFVPQTRRRR